MQSLHNCRGDRCVCVCVCFETRLETMSQKQNKQQQKKHIYLCHRVRYRFYIFLSYICTNNCSTLNKAVKRALDGVMGTVKSQRQEDKLHVDTVTHSRVFAVCTGLLITRVYGHVSGWRSRILLQVD